MYSMKDFAFHKANVVWEVPGQPVPGGFDPFQPRPPDFPEGPARTWRDVYQLWLGSGPVPLMNFDLMWGCPADVDERIRTCFAPLLQEAIDGGLQDWEQDPRACFAKMILVDQLSRHVFRGRAEAFACDDLGRELARKCFAHMEQGHAYHIEEALLMAWPFIHSEDAAELEVAQNWLDLLVERMTDTPYRFRMMLHQYGVSRHVRVVRRFGRYPHRNAIMGRQSTPEELAYLKHEAEVWERDQLDASRGGTWRYQLGATAYAMRALLALASRSSVGFVAGSLWSYGKARMRAPKHR